MAFSLASLVRRVRNPRRSEILIRDIRPPAMFATNLYRATYGRIVAALYAAVPRVVAEYERSLPVRDSITDSADDISALFDTLGTELTRLAVDINPALRAWAARTEAWHRGQWRGSVLSAGGVDIETLLLASAQPATVSETIAWNVSLIRDVSQQAQQRISNAVFSGLQQRKTAADVAKEIRGAVDMSRRRSIGIASDQLSKLASGLDSERMHDAGIRKFDWIHSGKLHPRAQHLARNGKRYELITGKEVDGPGDIPADDMPGMKPWCGCRKRAVLELD